MNLLISEGIQLQTDKFDKVLERKLKGCSEEQLIRFEQKYDVKLPTSFRYFLKYSNAGTFRSNNVKLINGEEVAACYLYGLERPNDGISETYDRKRSWRDIPEFFFPFSSEGGGSEFLICLKGEHYGGVFFWDRAFYQGDPGDALADFQNMFKISDNFEGFLDILIESFGD